MAHSLFSLHPAWSEALVLEAAGVPEMPHGVPVAELEAAHARLVARLHAVRIHAPSGEYAGIWLDAEAEAEIDAAWSRDAEWAFWLHAVARSLCMSAVREMLPGRAPITTYHCAPVPAGDPELAQALRRAGLDCAAREALLLKRRYAVVSRSPLGGCGICALRDTCGGEDASGGPRG